MIRIWKAMALMIGIATIAATSKPHGSPGDWTIAQGETRAERPISEEAARRLAMNAVQRSRKGDAS